MRLNQGIMARSYFNEMNLREWENNQIYGIKKRNIQTFQVY